MATRIDLGSVIGPQGPQGEKGEKGDPGSSLDPRSIHRMTAGTVVVPADKTGTSRQLMTSSQINNLLGVSNSSNANTAVFVSNGDGAASGVHMEGCTYLNKAWHVVFNTNVGSSPIRVNYFIVYWG